MPFPKSSQRLGGSRPSTPAQKSAARAWAIAHQPWLKSVGPRSSQGKAIAALNAERGCFKRTVRSWEFPDLAAFEAECSAVQGMVSKLKEIVQAQTIEFEFVETRRQSAVRGDGRQWRRWSVKIELCTASQDLEPIWTALREVFANSTDGKCKRP